MRGILRFAPVLLASSLFATTVNLNTGVAAWQGSGPNVTGSVAAQNLGAGGALGVNPTGNTAWLTPPAGSGWISTLATDGQIPQPSGPTLTGLPGTYTFTFTFATAGLGGSLSYISAGDNQVTVVVSLNGTPINTFNHPGNTLNAGSAPGCAFLPAGSTICGPPPAQGEVGPGTITWAAGGAGTITITATVVNTQPPSPSPVGFLLGGTATFTDPGVPEPSTYAMLGLGSVALIAARIRRK